MTNATPTKLKNGSWGARVLEGVIAGDIVKITTRAGKTWQAVVTSVERVSNGWATCATKSHYPKTTVRPSSAQYSRPSTRRKAHGTWTGCHCGSVEEYTKSSDCWTCKHDAI